MNKTRAYKLSKWIRNELS